MVNSKRIGSSETMVASIVVVPPAPPVTRLPGETRRSPIRPATGARNSVNSRSSSAWRTAASLAATEAARRAEGLGALVEGLLGQGAVAHELLGAIEIGFGEGEIGLGLRQRALRLGDGVLERPLVDGEQQIALLDHLAVAEMDLIEIARDAGAHLDRIHRDEAADIFVLLGDAALDRLRHRHRRRRRRPAARRLALPAGDQQRRKQDNGGGKPRIRGVNHGAFAASKTLMLQCGKIKVRPNKRKGSRDCDQLSDQARPYSTRGTGNGVTSMPL